MKIEFTLRGPRVIKCRKHPALVGRVFPWAGVKIRQIQGGGHLLIPLPDQSDETLMAMLEMHEVPLVRRARRRHIKLAAADGTLDLRYRPEQDSYFVWKPWQFAIVTAVFWGMAVYAYVTGVHQPYGWPPIGPGSQTPLGNVLPLLTVLSLYASVPLLIFFQIRRYKRRPFVTRLTFEDIRINGFPGDDLRVPLEDIEVVVLLGHSSARLKIIDGSEFLVLLNSIINVDAIRAMSGAVRVDDFRARTQATLYLLLRALGIGAAICVLAIIGLFLSGVQVPGQVYAMMATPPVFMAIMLGFQFFLHKGFERGSGKWAKYKRSRKRALRRS